jgi:hypothetical protein
MTAMLIYARENLYRSLWAEQITKVGGDIENQDEEDGEAHHHDGNDRQFDQVLDHAHSLHPFVDLAERRFPDTRSIGQGALISLRYNKEMIMGSDDRPSPLSFRQPLRRCSANL